VVKVKKIINIAHNINIKFMKKTILTALSLMFLCLNVWAQSDIRGRVIDDKGEGIPGASIKVKNTNRGAFSDNGGNFTVKVNGGETLIVSSLGFKTQEVPAEDGVTVKMTVEKKSLEGVVVTALGIKREKAALGYAATTLKTEELNRGNSTNVLGALQGKVSGVNITSNTGGPGGSVRAVIRGEKSITGNNNALIVVDGIPINNGNRTSDGSSQSNNGSRYQVDFGNRGTDINPDDVESVTVLKGAAATALYGSAGANGAIMITTKSGKLRKNTGKKGVGDINFSSAYTVSDILKYPDFQNKYGQGNIYVGSQPADPRENFSWGDEFNGDLRPWGQEIAGQRKIKPYSALENNTRDFFNFAQTLENNLSFSGASDKTTYFLSFNSMNNTGVVPGNFFDRYSIRFNANHEFSNKFFSSLNMNYINGYSKTDQQGQGSGSIWNNVLQTARDIPITELKDLNDPFNSYTLKDADGNNRYGFYGAYAENPYWVTKNFDNRNRYDRILGQTSIGYHLNSNLDIVNRLGGEVIADRTTYKAPKLLTTGTDPLWDASLVGNKNFAGGFYEGIDNIFSLNNDLMLMYKSQLSDKINIGGVLGQSITSSRSTFNDQNIDPVTNGLVIPDFYNFTNAQSKVISNNIITQRRKIGHYLTLNADYDRTLFLELTGRVDKSSTLAKGLNTYFYPAVSGSWIFSNYLKNTKGISDILSYGKLRANITQVGNDAGAYQNNNSGYASQQFNLGFGSTIFPFNEIPGFSLGNTIGNPNLKNETTITREVGVDLGFWKDRILLDFTYYNSLSKDLIVIQPISRASGFSFQTDNVGTMSNKGFELGLKIAPVVTRNMRWELFGQYSKNVNKVESLKAGLDQVTVGGFGGMSIVAAVGQPYGSFYTTGFKKDPNGNVIVNDLGNPKSADTAQIWGSFQPKFIASWGSTFTWKGLSANILFDTKQGGMFYSRTKDIMEFVGTSESTLLNDRKDFIWPGSVTESVNANGTTVYTPNTTTKTSVYHYYTDAGIKPQSENLQDATYLKLREVSLNYSFNSKLFEKTFLNNATLGIYGNNLAIWTKNAYVDPEVNSGGASNEQGLDFSARPSLRNYGVRFSIGF
jgi:TonB-linked SusC/RagA family outer membrane protein